MIRRTAVAAALAALACATGLVLAAAPRSDARVAYPPVRPTRVLVLGDSVMKGAVAAYPQALPGREVVVDAEVNRTTGQGADRLAELGTDWDVVVVLLAHNDGGSPGVYQPAAQRLLGALARVRRVSWLTLHEVRPAYVDVNRFLVSSMAEHPNLRVADWNSVARAHPEGLAADGLHLNATGAQLLADVVRQQVEVAELEFALDLQRLTTTTSTTTTTTTTTTTAPPTTTTAPPATTAPTTAASAPTSSSEPERSEATVAEPGDDGADGPPPAAWAAGGAGVVVLAGGALVLRGRTRRRVSD